MKSFGIKILILVCFVSLIIPNVCMAEERTYSLLTTDSLATDWNMGAGYSFAGGKIKNDSNNFLDTRVSVYGGVNWSGNYTYSVTAYNEFGAVSNKALIIFNYVDNSNYYFVSFGGDKDGTTVILNKMVSGNNTVIATYSGAYPLKSTSAPTISINYNNGVITVKGTRASVETILFDKISDSTFTSGKIGVGSASSVGDFYNFSVIGNGEEASLKVLSSSMPNNQTDVEYTPTIKIHFNIPLKVSSVTTANVLLATGGVNLSSDRYTVSLEDNNTTLVVSVTSPLNANIINKLQITSGVVSEKFSQGLSAPYNITFLTKPYPFVIEALQVFNSSNVDITNNLAGLTAGAVVTFKGNLKNNSAAALQDYSVTVAIVNGNNQMLAKKTFAGKLPLNTSLPISGTDTISANLDNTCTLQVFVVDSFSGMKRIFSVNPVLFDESADFINVSASIKNDTVTVSGILPNNLAGRIMNLTVINPNKNILDVTTDNSVIQNQAQITTTTGGAFTYTFAVNSFGITSGYFSVIIGGDDFSSIKQKTVYFSTKDERTAAITAINTADNLTMESLIVNNADTLYLHFPLFDILTDKSNIALMVLERVKQQAFDSTDLSAFQEFIKKCSVLEAYNQGKSSDLVSPDGRLLYNDILQLDTLDNTGLTVYNFYQNSLSLQGRNIVNANLLNKNYTNISGLYNEFIRQVVLRGISYCNQDGYGHINDLLVKNAVAAGLNLASYNSTNADRKLLSKSVTDIATLQLLINDLSKPEISSSVSSPNRSSGLITVGGNIPKTQDIQLKDPLELKKATFVDLDGVEWAKQAILRLVDKKVIAEPIDGKFNPNDSITRQEFVKLVVVALGLDVSKIDVSFEDVSTDDWSAPYISAAKKEGVTNGISEIYFGKNDFITRQDVATIVYRAFKPTDTLLQQPVKFTDVDTISSYAIDAVACLTDIGVLNGMQDGSFAPTEFCTRAQAAKIINAMLK